MVSVLVTGSSSGFGDLIVRTLAADGARVFATMRGIDGRNAAAAALLTDWAAEQGYALDVVELDVSSDASVAQAIASITAAAGPLDVVVNNAGISAFGPMEAFDVGQMAALLDINVLGPMRVNKAVLPAMRARGAGLIVWISSTLGRVLPGRGGLYPATKWAAEGFAESLHHQVAPFGIDVAILEPGSFPTGASARSLEAADAAVTAVYAALPAGPRATPNGSYVPPDPQEVADAVLQLMRTPAGGRPLRTVVGPLFTEGVDEYNQAYLALRAHMEEVLRRPDQAITWFRSPPRT